MNKTVTEIHVIESTEFLNRQLQLELQLSKNTWNRALLARSTQSSKPVVAEQAKVESWSCHFKCLNPKFTLTSQVCQDFKSLPNNVLRLVLPI
jgi:hypothetical protein